MLIDHIGAALTGSLWMRVVGRIAFPVFCYLIAEGAAHTRNPKRYGLRLFTGVLLAELPFDLMLYGRWTWGNQSVMLTLLLGFLYGQAADRMKNLNAKVYLVVPFTLAAEWLRTDYGGFGVMVIALFILTREMPRRLAVQTLGMTVLCLFMGSALIRVGPVKIPIELFAVAAIIPIACYHGKKRTASRWLQWGVYLFYPVHMLVLCWLR
jgi:hypothetical protein